MSEPTPINPYSTNPELQQCAIRECGHAKYKHRSYPSGGLFCYDCNSGQRVEGPCFTFGFHAIGCKCRWHGDK